ncbi:M23 family metallopeptidase [Alsobacter sp. SYSU M60028]|uniref:M23 family metallopeptidase n=1 Tax=Alsobacter ponti TaxID=2962936 RepID=A0ABT1LE16_9HYPH|nr:M23 family metallopeptidase [Alsobacter ponti]
MKTAKVEVAEPAKSAAKTAATPAAAPAAAPEETTSSIATATKSSAEFRWPAKGRVITGFGNKGGGSNDGINIALPEGTPVKAAEGGVVAYAGNELKGYGNLVLIRHPDGWVTAYAHNGDIKVKRGDTVTRGQTIASSGQSGNVSSPQLHFEIRKGSTPVDPMPHLSGQ